MYVSVCLLLYGLAIRCPSIPKIDATNTHTSTIFVCVQISPGVCVCACTNPRTHCGEINL